MQRIIVILAIVLTLASCATQKRCNEKFPPQVIVLQKDSIQYIDVVRDSISYYSDSSYVTALLECDEHGQVIMKELLDYKSGNHIAPPHVIMKDNVITAACNVDSMEVYHRMQKQISTSIKEIKKESIKYTNILTPFQKFKCKAFWWESAVLLTILLTIIITLFYGKRK